MDKNVSCKINNKKWKKKMNEEMKPNHHKTLTKNQIDAINFLKEKERELIYAMSFVIDSPIQYVSYDNRWMHIAETHIEQGIMAAIRSIAETQQSGDIGCLNK